MKDKIIQVKESQRRKEEVKCLYLDDSYCGVFKIGKNKEGSVRGFLPGEVGVVEEINKPNGITYRLVKVLKPSSSRVDVKCKVYNKCGSCHLLHMNYQKQIEYKKDYVSDALKQYKINTKIDEIIPATKTTRYRNKMQVCYTYSNDFHSKDVLYGFYEDNSHKVIPFDDCLVHSEKQNEIVKSISKIIKELNLSLYNEDKRTGLIRFVMIREAIKTGEILVTIVTQTDIFPSRSEFVKRLLRKCPYITSIVQNINKRKTSIILGDDERILYGNGYIIDILCGISFRISSKTFYQINSYQTELLYNKVIEYANLTGNENVLDAYCGVGTIGMILSKRAKNVIGVENNKQSVINARDNAYNNKINNIKFVNMDATEYLQESIDYKFDVVVMDPPRSGSTEMFLQALKKVNPKTIIYVSCEAKTLARDLQLLLDRYKIEKKAICDMFVGTCHIETIVLLQRVR